MMTAIHQEHLNPTRAIGLKLVSVVLFTVMSALIKSTADQVPTGQIMFFRSAFALVPIFLLLGLRGQIATAFRTSNLRGHAWRSGIGLTAMALSFFALAHLALPDAVAIGYSSPLFATALAGILLGETVRFYRWTAVIAGLAGVVVMLWPKLNGLQLAGGAPGLQALAALAAVGAAFLAALAMIHVRRLVKTERSSTIVVYFSCIAAAAAALTFPFGWAMPSATTLGLLVCVGLIGGIAQIFLTESYRFAEASAIAPFEYASMLVAVAIGYWVFGELPTPLMVTGALIVIAAGLFIIYRERQLGLAHSGARRVLTPQG